MIGGSEDWSTWEAMPEWEAQSEWYEQLGIDRSMATAAAFMLSVLVSGMLTAYFVIG